MKQRQASRYWTIPGTKATFIRSNANGETEAISSRVWDISERNCGFDSSNIINFKPKEKEAGKLVLKGNRGENDTFEDAVIERIWDTGMAVSFAPSGDAEKYYAGEKPESRSHGEEFGRQKDIALIEIGELSSNIRELKNCQLRLFLTCFTISIGLGSLLTVVHKMGASIAMQSLIAIAPAAITIILGLLSLQKEITLNRTKSFIMHLKSQLNQGWFWPGYRGWEEAMTILKNCKHMNCSFKPRCTENIGTEMRSLPKKLVLRFQPILFTAILSISYLAIYLVSIILQRNMGSRNLVVYADNSL